MRALQLQLITIVPKSFILTAIENQEMERRGQMVTMSDTQPEVVGSNPREVTAWYL
jgi:hypothetical protein